MYIKYNIDTIKLIGIFYHYKLLYERITIVLFLLINFMLILVSSTLAQIKLSSVPFGNIDYVSSGNISGWAYDPDAGSDPIYVDFYIDDIYSGRTLSDWYRPDLSNNPNIQGVYHGFDWTTPALDKGNHSVKVFALNHPNGNNIQLSGTKYINIDKGTVFLDNGILRVGVSLDWGGAITEILSDSINLVDKHDTGRLIQMSFFDGVYGVDNADNSFHNWGWNPVQGGDMHNHGSPVLSYFVNDTIIYTKTQPIEWNPDNKGGGIDSAVLSQEYIEQWVSLSDNIVKLKYRVHYFGIDDHMNVSSQEFPCLYVNPNLNRIYTYDGINPWIQDGIVEKNVPPYPSYLDFMTTEYWSAYVDNNNFGITVFSTTLSPFFGATRFTETRTNYLYHTCHFDVPSNSIFTTDIYFIIGNVNQNRQKVYDLRSIIKPHVSWEFEEEGNREGWVPWNQLSSLVVSNGTMKASATGNDPYMINYSALDIDAIEYDKIKIKMRVNSGQEASVYFTTVSDRDWGENKVKHFPITSDNEFHTYILDMKTIKKWSDKIYQIRFDPANSQASNIEIEYIHIIPKGKPPILLALPDLCFIEDDSLSFDLSNWYGYVEDPDNPDSTLNWTVKGNTNVFAFVNQKFVNFFARQNWFGFDTLSVIVSDEEFSDTTSLIVHVQPINDAPMIVPFPDITMRYNDTLSINLNKFVVDVDDADTSLRWSAVSSNDSLVVTIDQNNRAYFTALKFEGKVAVEFTVRDDSLAEDRDTLFVTVTAPTSVGGDLIAQLPTKISLSQNYPNPFNIETAIKYELPEPCRVSLKIFNCLGEEVATLVESFQAADRYKVVWYADRFPSGVYFARLQAGVEHILVQKFLMLK